MILAVDVHYEGSVGYCAGVTFNEWSASEAEQEFIYQHTDVLKYVPGHFYKRELPCIMGLISRFAISPNIIVIDGYVFLDGTKSPGLGKHLFDALNGSVVIVGVAKSAFAGIGNEFSIYRGQSNKPLFVTAIGDNSSRACQNILKMHGAYRIPSLLRRVDKLSKSAAC